MGIYDAGDYVICRSGGVWLVEEAGREEAADHPIGYTLRPLGTERGTQYVPVGESEILRKIVSKEEMMEILSRIPYTRTIQAPNSKIREELYEEAMEQYDEIEWIKVIKTVYLRAREKRLTPNEEAYSDRAKQYFYGEISVLLGIPVEQVEEYITTSINDDVW